MEMAIIPQGDSRDLTSVIDRVDPGRIDDLSTDVPDVLSDAGDRDLNEDVSL